MGCGIPNLEAIRACNVLEVTYEKMKNEKFNDLPYFNFTSILSPSFIRDPSRQICRQHVQ